MRRVYNTFCEGNPARNILIGELCKTNEAKRKAVGKDKGITDKWVEEQLTDTHLTNTASQVMQLKDPKVAPPTRCSQPYNLPTR
jgi:hypothetical protein